MKKLIILFLAFAPLFGYSQYTYFSTSIQETEDGGNTAAACTKCTVYGDKPAPCSIEGDGHPYPVYLIRVGVYQRALPPKRGITLFKIGDFHHYFLEEEFLSEGEAKQKLASVRASGFCDAVVVRHPFNKINYR